MMSPGFRCLVPFTQSVPDDKLPLFVVHGAGGGVSFLQEFGQREDSTRAVFGFRAHGLDGSAAPDTDVGAMVERYVAELRLSHPGPYLLGGYSSGGTIALEMAARLQNLGERVDRVILFDAWPKGDATQTRAMRHLRWIRYLLTDGPSAVRPYVSHIVGNRFGRSGATLETLPESPGLDDSSQFFGRTLDILARHDFGRYDVEVVLIKAEYNWPSLPRDYMWTPLLTRSFEIRIARGHHITMWWPHYVGDLVALVEDILEQQASP